MRKWLAADNGHFVWFARVSYGWFIAVHYKLKLSTYIQEALVIGMRCCVQREI
jgi:hypothetical protein